MAEQFAAGFPDDEFTVTGDPGQIAAVTASLRAIGQHCVECAAELRRVRPDWVAVEEVKWSFLRDSRYEEILRAGRAYAQAAGAFGPFGTQLADLQRRMALVRQDAEAAYARLQSARQTLVSDGAKAAVELVTKGPAALGSATQQAVGRDKATVDAVQGEYEALRSQAQALRSEAQSDAARCAGQLNQIDRPGGTPAERAAAFQAEQAAKVEAAKEGTYAPKTLPQRGLAAAQGVPAFLHTVKDAGALVGEGWVATFHHRLGPKPVQYEAAGLLVAGTGLGIGYNFITGKQQRLFDDGDPISGTPAQERDYPAPENFATLTEAAVDAYRDDQGNTDTMHGEPRVIAVRKPNQPTRYIVTIPGTQAPKNLDGIRFNPNGHGWSPNGSAVAFGHSVYSSATMQAIDRAIAMDQGEHCEAPLHKPQIVLTGHSQGGITAANIAADKHFRERYDVRGVVTYGAPIEAAKLGDTPTLALQHGDFHFHRYERDGQVFWERGGDVVPWLDQNLGSSAGMTQVDLPAPYPAESHPAVSSTPPEENSLPITHVSENHDQTEYLNSVRRLSGSNQEQVREFERHAGLADFYAGRSSEDSVYIAPAGAR